VIGLPAPSEPPPKGAAPAVSGRAPWTLRVALVGAALVALGLAVYRFVRAPEIERVAGERLEHDLAATASALANGLGREGVVAKDLSERIRSAGRVARMRFTIVGENGAVLADSEATDLATLDNHAKRPEIVAALEQGRSSSRRTSATVSRALWYAAERIPGTRAVARVALDAREAEALLAEETRFPWAAGLLAALVAGAVAALLFGPTAAGVRAVALAIRGIESGDLSARVPVRGPDFLRGLSSSFNGMAGRLQEDVDRVRAERARLQTVLDGMVEGVFALDASESIRFLNRSARELLDVPDGERVEGRPVHELIRDPQVLTLVRTILSRREPQEVEIAWRGAPARLLHVHGAPVSDGGPGAILLVRDISTLRRLERMRSDFVANVSHELRTPLSAIAGAAETLEGGALSDPDAAPRFVESIGRQADRLRALVDDLLTLSRLESAPETIDRVPVDFGSVVRQACDAVAGRAREAGLVVETAVAGGVRVLGEPEALRRLVDNLVVNAVTYTPPGGWVRVTLEVEPGAAVLTVADSGIGIGPEHLERIFERFYRVDKARSRAKGGTGLGLAIVKHSVNLHGGEIEVRSRPGAGSAFTVRIPLPKEDA
jgi:two-component system phosphate regulon sensor histidine kinase PhoR